MISQVKELYQYFNHPFWQQSEMVANIRAYLKNHLRRMTPDIIENLSENKQNLERYFRSNQTWDNRIFKDNLRLKQDALDFEYNKYTLCQAKHEPLALNRQGEVYCSQSDCVAQKCPFQAIVARGEEVAFLTKLKDRLK